MFDSLRADTCPERAGVGDTGYAEFMEGVDTVVLGRNTYATVLGFHFWPYEGKSVEVLSTTLATDADNRITATSPTTPPAP